MLNKGLHRDTDPVNQPKDTYPFGKNGVAADKLGSILNEPGFRRLADLVPGWPFGAVPTDRYPILFSVSSSKKLLIHLLNTDDETIDLVLDTGTLVGAPDVDPENYITGESERNYKGELVVAFTDKTLRPMFLNCDQASLLTDYRDLYLLPSATPVTASAEVVDGGSLEKGQYVPFISYNDIDGTATHFIPVAGGVIVGNDGGKSLEVTIDNLDTRYDQVTLGVLYRTNGTSKAFKLVPKGITGTTMTLRYSGSETVTDLLVSELITIPPDYTKVGTMGQLEGSLYTGDLEVDESINYQKWALNVKLKWKSELLDLRSVPEDHVMGKERSFMHQEVYAVYVRIWTKSGRVSNWFTIPGNSPQVGDETVITYGDVTDKTYKVTDTIHNLNVGDKKGDTGIWINETETYPDHASFDATSLPGGRNLRNQPVLHHRMPSVEYLKNNLYAADATYGKSHLDILGIEVESGLIVPAVLADKIAYFELGFAQRNTTNSLVLGYAPLFYPAMNKDEYAANNFTGDLWSQGANWDLISTFEVDNVGVGTLVNRINNRAFRIHPFEGLFYEPKATIASLQMQLKLKALAAQIEDIRRPGDDNNTLPLVYLADYVEDAAITVPLYGPRKVKSNQYLPNNKVSGRWRNLMLEKAIVGEFDASSPAFTDYPTEPDGAEWSETALTAILLPRNDAYSSFLQQLVIPFGVKITPGNAAPVAYTGDAFVGLYTLHCYGYGFTVNPPPASQFGLRVVHRLAMISAANLNMRYEDVSNIYSQYYPVSPLVANDPENYITLFLQNNDPNQFGYDRDFNSLADYDAGTIYDPFNPEQTKFPYRVHRLGKMGDDKKRSWRNILALDYYEMQRNMGKIINLDSYADRLLVHMENALYITADKVKLAEGPLAVTLGTGDIFQFPPQEGLTSPLGYGGTQHDLACVRTPMGYLFPDAKTGEMFVYNGKMRLLNNGLNDFFRTYLRIKDKNPFVAAGITIGYDPHFKRFMLTIKSKRLLLNQVVKSPDDALVVGDVVQLNGRLLSYAGENNPAYPCSAPAVEEEQQSNLVAPNLVTSIPEDSAVPTDHYTYGVPEADTYAIMAGNGAGKWQIVGSILRLIGALDYDSMNQFILTIRATRTSDSAYADFTHTVNVTEIVPAGSPNKVIHNNTYALGDVYIQLQVAEDAPEGGTMYFLYPGDTPTVTLANVVYFKPMWNLGVRSPDRVMLLFKKAGVIVKAPIFVNNSEWTSFSHDFADYDTIEIQ